ncbi:hypothetical protein ACFL1U_02515 [Patescibacteria group bacterium]
MARTRPPHLTKISGWPYWRYRILESVPALLTWGTFIGIFLLSILSPYIAAYFIVLYSLWWLVKAAHVSFHLINTYIKLGDNTAVDWQQNLKDLDDPRTAYITNKARLRELQSVGYKNMFGFKDYWQHKRKLRNLKEYVANLKLLAQRVLPYKWNELYHVVLIPSVNEGRKILDTTLDSILATGYPMDRVMIVLAFEERAGEQYYIEDAKFLKDKYGDKFWKVETFTHPDGIVGELKGRGPNATYAARKTVEILEQENIALENVILSSFDADTVPSNNYFHQLTYFYLTTPNPTKHSYQPLPLFFNNLWDAPMLSRISSMGSTFWQMIEASRSHRLLTFSSHAMSMKSLKAVNYWPLDVVQDDSQIFWRMFIHYKGDYDVLPLPTTVKMDCVLGNTYWETLKAQYKQKRRWAWGVGDFAYVTQIFWRKGGAGIPFRKRLVRWARLVEGHYTWSTTAIILALGGWLPFMLNKGGFELSVVSENFFSTTRILLTVALVGLVINVIVSMYQIPQPPKDKGWWMKIIMVVQWVLAPVATVLLGSFPAIEAQTRYLTGHYLGFYVVPKVRKSKVDINKFEASTIKHDA